ncbi:MAG: sugar phosphate isomerase/epimerase [Anaerofustis stercorihominis]|nr:sugar phosphate isomerase/epimerase [Anaerofustis stercorihominis]
MNKYGTYTWFGYTVAFEERLKAIKDAGFDTICTFWAREMDGIDAPGEYQAEIADRHGLYLEHSHLPYFNSNIMWNDDIAATDMRDMYIDGIKRAKRGGLKTLVIHTCDIYAPDMQRYHLFMENMKKVADAAEKYEIRLAVENLGDNLFLRNVLDDLKDNPYVGMCFDSGHNNIVAKDDFSLLREYSGRIYATHIHDNDAVTDKHILPYSEGCNVDWKKFMEVMSSVDFDGSLMLEASYPINYDDYDGENDVEIPNPSYPMENWLRDAAESCRRIYAEL